MSALFRNVVKQALLTFDQRNATAFLSNFNNLKLLVDQLTVRDININSELLLSERAFNVPDKAPCTYVHIVQCDDVSIGVFILRGNYTMPLHDHPMMYGLLKTIFGRLRIQSYSKMFTAQDNKLYDKDSVSINVLPEPEKIAESHTESAVLTPANSNFHEITAIGGVAAFFDILSPPYETDIPIYGKRPCNYYGKIPKENFYTLQTIPPPSNYSCDRGEYEPPGFIYEQLFEKYMSGKAF